MYLYPLSVFTKSQFNRELVRIGISSKMLFSRLNKSGWIKLWSEQGDNNYYSLSYKGKELVTRIHKMCMMEEEIPMSTRRNKITKSKSQVDKGLMDLFKEFNSKIKGGN